MPPQYDLNPGLGDFGGGPSSPSPGMPSDFPMDSPYPGEGDFGGGGFGGAPPISGVDKFLRIMSVIVPLAGAYYNAKSSNEAEEAQRRALAEAQRILSPEEYNRMVTQLLPGMRAQAVTGPGQQAKQAIDTAVSRGRLTGSGVGEAFKTIGSSLPAVEASRGAASAALGLQGMSASALLRGAELYDAKANPLVESLNAALQGYFEYETRRGRLKAKGGGTNTTSNSLFPTVG